MTDQPTIRTSQPLKWHGGKHYLAKQIISLFPPHVHYIEPYFGGGAVLFAKPVELVEGHSEAINDIDWQLTNFWYVLRDKHLFPFMQRFIESSPFAQDLWKGARFATRHPPNERPPLANDEMVSLAAAFFVRYRQSRQGLGKDFATLSRNRTRRGMNEQVSSWLSAVEGLPAAHERLKRVVIFSDDGVKVIRQQDGPNTLFYCDPPYLHETRTVPDAYGFEMTRAQHEELLDTLAGIKGRFLLSGYPSLLYRDAAKRHGWSCRQFAIDNKASGAKTKPKMIECVWFNF